MDEKDKYKNSISQIKRKSYRTTEEILHDTLKAIMWFWIAFIYESNKMIVKSVNEGSKRADVTNSGLFYKPPSVAETMKYTSYMELQQHLRVLNKQSIDNINDIIRKAGDITTVSELKDMIVKELESENVYKIRYSNGAQVTPEKYAAMVARSARMETANTTHIAYAKENGTDLVQCIGPYETCEVCAQYVDRVFSISGKDKRYPSLYDTALKKGYNIIHPNCRHEFIPFFEEQHTKEENDKLREQSNRPFEDSRTMRQKNAYDLKQATNRKVWNELLSYEKAKSALGKDMPYKTLSAYRRAHRKGEDSFDYKKSHNLLKDYEQYGKWKKVLGDKEMPETLAEFQEMKYNNSKKFELLKDYKNSVDRGAVSPLIGYKKYSEIKDIIDKKIVGLEINGKAITGQRKHFIDRVIGSVEQKRNGVSIENIIKCIENGQASVYMANKKGQSSMTIKLEHVCKLSLNKDMELIQVNPLHRS